jgi:ferredoxin
MATIRFLPKGVCIEALPGQTLFDLGWKQDLGIQSACVGKGTCGLCRVKIVSGEDQLSPYNEIEDKHLGNLYHLTKLRLSCQSTVIESSSDEEIVVEVRQKKKRKKD